MNDESVIKRDEFLEMILNKAHASCATNEKAQWITTALSSQIKELRAHLLFATETEADSDTINLTDREITQISGLLHAIAKISQISLELCNSSKKEEEIELFLRGQEALKKQRVELANLINNVKCGNQCISDPALYEIAMRFSGEGDQISAALLAWCLNREGNLRSNAMLAIAQRMWQEGYHIIKNIELILVNAEDEENSHNPDGHLCITLMDNSTWISAIGHIDLELNCSSGSVVYIEENRSNNKFYMKNIEGDCVIEIVKKNSPLYFIVESLSNEHFISLVVEEKSDFLNKITDVDEEMSVIQLSDGSSWNLALPSDMDGLSDQEKGEFLKSLVDTNLTILHHNQSDTYSHVFLAESGDKLLVSRCVPQKYYFKNVTHLRDVTSSSPIDRLPVTIAFEIASYLSVGDLKKLVCVSRYWEAMGKSAYGLRLTAKVEMFTSRLLSLSPPRQLVSLPQHSLSPIARSLSHMNHALKIAQEKAMDTVVDCGLREFERVEFIKTLVNEQRLSQAFCVAGSLLSTKAKDIADKLLRSPLFHRGVYCFPKLSRSGNFVTTRDGREWIIEHSQPSSFFHDMEDSDTLTLFVAEQQNADFPFYFFHERSETWIGVVPSTLEGDRNHVTVYHTCNYQHVTTKNTVEHTRIWLTDGSCWDTKFKSRIKRGDSVIVANGYNSQIGEMGIFICRVDEMQLIAAKRQSQYDKNISDDQISNNHLSKTIKFSLPENAEEMQLNGETQIVQVSPTGHEVMLWDGSIWTVSPSDTARARSFAQDTTISMNHQNISLNGFKLTNNAGNEDGAYRWLLVRPSISRRFPDKSIAIDMVKGPHQGSRLRLQIETIDTTLGHVVLKFHPNISWSLTPAGQKIVQQEDWRSDDTICILQLCEEESDFYGHILFNVNTDSSVGAHKSLKHISPASRLATASAGQQMHVAAVNTITQARPEAVNPPEGDCILQ